MHDFCCVTKVVLISYILNYRLKSVLLNTVFFWDAASNILVETYQCFGGGYSLHHQDNHRPDDGGNNMSGT
jgi:hypothetical protein